MPVPGTWAMITFVTARTVFYDLVDVAVDGTIGDGQFVVLSQTKEGLTLGFQRVPDVLPSG